MVEGEGGGEGGKGLLPGGVEPVLFVSTKKLLSMVMSHASSVFLTFS